MCYECQPAAQGEQPAFPVQASDYGGHGTCFGLTIRDYFAAKALQGMCSNGDWVERMSVRTGTSPEIAASMAAYEVADAMIAARVKP
ncbi:hypothetical protein IRZ53_17470 [Pseudomonas fulva]|nr:hypothetical protein [Pseudomonas fulva]MBF8698576.1 hypothetical protein [Pseudomonas fulva]